MSTYLLSKKNCLEVEYPDESNPKTKIFKVVYPEARRVHLAKRVRPKNLMQGCTFRAILEGKATRTRRHRRTTNQTVLRDVLTNSQRQGGDPYCSLPLWRVVRGIILTYLASRIHGLFIT